MYSYKTFDALFKIQKVISDIMMITMSTTRAC